MAGRVRSCFALLSAATLAACCDRAPPEPTRAPEVQSETAAEESASAHGRTPPADCPITAEEADQILHAALGEEYDFAAEQFFPYHEDIAYKPMRDALWDSEREVWYLRGFWGFHGHVEATVGRHHLLDAWSREPAIHYSLNRPRPPNFELLEDYSFPDPE
jgi:hypothetical protein